ncbi:MAG TPA: acyl-CoA dehydrogenase family protein [Polyangiales bacterium]|nr:acyl-CoA dehydrogenase family protein [Polyangiales bacterium]
MINLEIPKKLRPLIDQAHQVGLNVFRPIARKYDTAEHEEPKELRMFGAIMRGMSEGGAQGGLNAKEDKSSNGSSNGHGEPQIKNGGQMATLLGMLELCWGDVGLALSIPGQGLGNAAITAVATPAQKERFGDKWAAMAITEPGAGSDSAAIKTTAVLDGDEWVLNGEKIYVTAGERCEAVVVWATLDARLGRAAIKSFVVEKPNPGMTVARLEKKMGIRASDTATIILDNCRIPKDNLLGSAEVDPKKSFAGVMQTFDNTRPIVAAMSIGVARAALERTKALLEKEGVRVDYGGSQYTKSAVEAELLKMEADLEVARLLTVRAAWMADNKQPNSTEASMAKAKAGRVGNAITLKCVELLGALGYGETELIEKWARDSKILDIFEGTQQIQLLIIARRLLNLTSAQLR